MPGSAVSGASSGLSKEGSEKALLADEDEDQGLHSTGKNTNVFEEAVFGVLFVLQNEKPPESKFVVLLTFIVEWVQLLMFLLDPVWGWNINFRNVFWKWLARFQLENAVTGLSYELWIAVFYIMIVMLCATIGIAVYISVSFKTGSFPYTAPLMAMRVLCAVLFKLFYVSVVSVFLVSLSCYEKDHFAPGDSARAGDTPEIRQGSLRAFPDVQCLSTGHAIHGIIAIVAVPTVAFLGFVITLGDATQDALSGDFFAASDTLYKLRFFCCKTLVPFFMAFLPEHRKLLSLFYLVLYLLPFFDQLVQQPFMHAEANHLNAALRGVHFWGAIVLVANMYNAGPEATHLLTDVALYASPFVFFLCLAINAVRLRLMTNLGHMYLSKARFIAGQEPVVKPETVADAMYGQRKLRFRAPSEVDVVARIVRQVRLQAGAERDHTTIIAAEAALVVGMRQFPEEPLLPLLYGCFITHVLQDPGTGAIFFERARGMKPGPRLRFVIFVRDRQRKQKAQGEAAGEGAMDLVSYVEFQKSFTQLIRGHRAALRSNRRFWRLLIKAEVTFASLANSFRVMDKAEQKADRAYRSVLERYPKSTKVLRAYANFLEEVRNNPWSAKRFYDEAQKLDDAAEDDAANEGEEGGVMKVNDKVDAVAVISTTGVIKVVNRCLVKMFGYRRQEDLIGKNISILMPPPYSQQHNTYLKRYMATGTAHILAFPQKLEAKHKQGNIFNVNLLVNKVESGGETTFMGVMQQVLDDGSAMAVLTQTGVIRSANPIFNEMFGMASIQGGEATGKNFKSFLNGSSMSAQIDEILSKVGQGGEEVERSMEGCAKNGKIFPISCLFQVADRNSGHHNGAVVVKIIALNDNVGIITIDEVGAIEHGNTFISRIFGYKIEELSTMNISQLMPRPYSRFHAQYLANFRRTGVAKVLGDIRGRTVAGLHKDGRVFNIRLEVQEVKDEGQTKRLFSGRITLDASDVTDRRCCKLKMSDDGDIITLSDSAEDLFGVVPNDLVGFPIEEFLRWPDGTTEMMLECLLSIPAHNRVAGAAVVAKGKLIDGSSPPVLQMMVPVAGDPKNLTKVCVEAAPCDEPHSVELNIWSAPLLEGTVSIDPIGKITDISLGAALLFGYRESELLGNEVTTLMKSKMARHHPTFLARFKDAQSRKLVGTRRVVEAMHRDGTSFRTALEVSDADVPRGRADDTGAAFSARIVMTIEECSVYPKVVTTDPTGDDGRDAAKAAAYLKFRTNPEIPAHRASSRASGSQRSASQRSGIYGGSMRSGHGGRQSEGERSEHGAATGAASAASLAHSTAAAAAAAARSAPPPPIKFDDLHANAVTAVWENFADSHLETGKAIMKRFFELDPTSLQRFSFRDVAPEKLFSDPRFEAHALTIMKGLDSVLVNIDNADALMDIIDGLGVSHAAREVDHDSMDALAEAMSDVFAARLGAAYSEDRREAWKAVAGVFMARIKYRLGKPRVFQAPVQPSENLIGQPILEANQSSGPVELLGGPRAPAHAVPPAMPVMPAGHPPPAAAGGGGKCPFGFDQMDAGAIAANPALAAVAAAHAAAKAAANTPAAPSPKKPPSGCPTHVFDSSSTSSSSASAPPEKTPASLLETAADAAADAVDEKEAEAAALGFDAETIARARRGHCLFFADPEDDVPEPAAWVGERPQAQQQQQQRGGGCLFADAMNGPVKKLPNRYERMLHQQRLKEQYAESLRVEKERKEAAAKAKAEVDAARKERARSLAGLWPFSVVVEAAGGGGSPARVAPEQPQAAHAAGEQQPARVVPAGPVVESVTGDDEHLNKGGGRDSSGGIKSALKGGKNGVDLLNRKSAAAGNGGNPLHGESKKHIDLGKRPSGEDDDGVDPERDSPEALAKSFAHKTTDLVLAEDPPDDAELGGGAQEDVDPSDLKDAEDLKMKRDAEFQRARRFKQVLKTLNNLKMRRAIQLLTSRTRWLLVLLGCCYLACFVVMEVQLTAIPNKFERLVFAGDLLKFSQRMPTLNAITLALTQAQPVNFTASVPELMAQLVERADMLDELLHGIYLGFDGELEFPDVELQNAIGQVRLIEENWAGGRDPWPQPGNVTTRKVSLWNLARSATTKMRVVGASQTVSPTQLLNGASNDVFRERRYITLNVPYVLYDGLTDVLKLEKLNAKKYMEETIQAQMVTAAVLGITFGFAFFVFKYLLDRLANARRQLFNVFLSIPRPVVMKLATKSTKLAIEEDGDEEDDDDDDDNDWAQRQALNMAKIEHEVEATEDGAVVGKNSNRHAVVDKAKMNQIAPIGAGGDGTIKIKTKTRTMNIKGSSSYAYLVPIIAWGLIGVTVFGISAQTLGEIANALGDLVYSNVEAAMCIRVRVFAVELIVAASAQPFIPEAVAEARAALAAEAGALLDVHTGLIYGDARKDLTGSLYVSAERQELLFGTGCLRTLKPCRPPTDPYYSATNYGLDAMVKQMVEQSQLLANDPLSQLTPNNERYRFIESVSPTDLFDAQTTSVKLYDVQSTQPAAVAQWMQIAVLPCLFAGKVIFLSRFFKPWIQQTLHETKRVAELLAQLPKEINVNALILESVDTKRDPKIAAALRAAGKKDIPRTARPRQAGAT